MATSAAIASPDLACSSRADRSLPTPSAASSPKPPLTRKEILVAGVDLRLLEDTRRNWPFLRDRPSTPISRSFTTISIPAPRRNDRVDCADPDSAPARLKCPQVGAPRATWIAWPHNATSWPGNSGDSMGLRRYRTQIVAGRDGVHLRRRRSGRKTSSQYSHPQRRKSQERHLSPRPHRPRLDPRLRTDFRAQTRSRHRCCYKLEIQRLGEIRELASRRSGSQEKQPVPRIPAWKPFFRLDDSTEHTRHPLKAEASVSTATRTLHHHRRMPPAPPSNAIQGEPRAAGAGCTARLSRHRSGALDEIAAAPRDKDTHGHVDDAATRFVAEKHNCHRDETNTSDEKSRTARRKHSIGSSQRETCASEALQDRRTPLRSSSSLRWPAPSRQLRQFFISPTASSSSPPLPTTTDPQGAQDILATSFQNVPSRASTGGDFHPGDSEHFTA